MTLQTVLSFLEPVVFTGLSAALVAALNSKELKALIASLSAKLDSEAASIESSLLHSNNAMVRTLVIEAMAYAEQHETALLTTFKSKADFVIARVSADPRFGSLGVPLTSIELIVEDVFESLYATIKLPPVDGHDHA